jgi:hypothetical protein
MTCCSGRKENMRCTSDRCAACREHPCQSCTSAMPVAPSVLVCMTTGRAGARAAAHSTGAGMVLHSAAVISFADRDAALP